MNPRPWAVIAGRRAAEPQPRHGRFEGAQRVAGSGIGEGSPDGDVAADAVPDGRDGSHSQGPDVGQDLHQVGDVARQPHHSRLPGALVAAPVVGDDVDLGQAPHDPAEALGPIQRAVHEHDGRRSRDAPGPLYHVESGRVAHRVRATIPSGHQHRDRRR